MSWEVEGEGKEEDWGREGKKERILGREEERKGREQR